jgi:methionine-rich copper-binding protein CopC
LFFEPVRSADWQSSRQRPGAAIRKLRRMHGIRRRDKRRVAIPGVRAAVAGLLLLLTLPGGVAAHAELVTSTPADGETITVIPAEAILTFSEGLAAASSFALLDASGATIATGAPDLADATVMRAALPAMAPGSYQIQWTAVADDGHIERGMFEFAVAEPTAAPATPTPAPTDAPTAAPTPSKEPTAGPIATPVPTAGGGSGAAGGMDVVLPIIAVVFVMGAGLAVMLRRRGPA